MNISKSTALDGIPARFLKDAVRIIKVPITFIINLSITLEIFPTEIKLAKVKPFCIKEKQDTCWKLTSYQYLQRF